MTADQRGSVLAEPTGIVDAPPPGLPAPGSRRGAALARRFAAYVDRYPGCSTAALYGVYVGNRTDSESARRLIENAGYRLAWPHELVDSWRRATGVDIDSWWPSAARCAELARTATGERRERLLQGMFMDRRRPAGKRGAGLLAAGSTAWSW